MDYPMNVILKDIRLVAMSRQAKFHALGKAVEEGENVLIVPQETGGKTDVGVQRDVTEDNDVLIGPVHIYQKVVSISVLLVNMAQMNTPNFHSVMTIRKAYKNVHVPLRLN